MSDDVTFNEPQYAPQGGKGPKQSLLTRIVISLGLAKDEASAQKALGVAAILIAALAIIVYFFWGR